jgi:hypothetical protein
MVDGIILMRGDREELMARRRRFLCRPCRMFSFHLLLYQTKMANEHENWNLLA